MVAQGTPMGNQQSQKIGQIFTKEFQDLVFQKDSLQTEDLIL